MGIVAAQTAFALLQGFMLEGSLICLCSDILMTFDTEGVAGFDENKRVIRSMGIVAGDAIAFYDNLVGAAGLIRHHFLVATVAQCGDIGNQKIFVGRRMRIMAAGTFTGFEQRMHRRAFERFLKRFMTPQAFRATCSGLKLHLMRCMQRGGDKKRNRHTDE